MNRLCVISKPEPKLEDILANNTSVLGKYSRYINKDSILVINRKLWDELGLQSNQLVDFNGISHLMYTDWPGRIILLPQYEVTGRLL